LLEHGGNISLAAQQYGIAIEHWLDLSTGINPDGYPIPPISPAIWQKLPLEEDGLIEAACAYYGCQQVLPVAGSQAALQVLPKLRRPGKVAMLSPMYQEHAHAWRQNAHEVTTFTTLNDDTLNQADVVLLCNPNNPTAQLFSPEALLQLHAKLASRGGWLIVDEAFMDATPEHSIARHSHWEGLIVLRSIGKFFGLAGIRAGFLLGAAPLLKQAQEMLGPWTLSGPSRFITKQALANAAWQNNTRLKLVQSSERLVMLLGQFGLPPQAGTALFQFVPTQQAAQLQHHLATQGIWLRHFRELNALRFGLPTESGWLRLEQALQEVAL